MTVNRSRSQNAELQEGATDGTYKKDPPNTSVVGSRKGERRLLPWQYGIADSPIKYLPVSLSGDELQRENPSDHG